MSKKYECSNCGMTFEDTDFPLDDKNVCPFCDTADTIRPFDETAVAINDANTDEFDDMLIGGVVHKTKPTGPPPKPESHLGLAVFSMFIGILPLGVLATINACLVDLYRAAGDPEGAKRASEKAMEFSIISIIIGSIFLLLLIAAICR